MGIWNAADEVGKAIQHKRELDKKVSESTEQTQQAAADAEKRHEENKEQGML